jgi:hypothetical protein
MIRYCTCPAPIQSANPRKRDCLRCSFTIHPTVLSSNTTMAEFFDRLADVFPGGKPPAEFDSFRRQCETRERAGRTHFGIGYMLRSNPHEAMEEAADAANYFFFDVLQHRQRQDGEDTDFDVALTGAWYAFKLHQAAQELSRKRRGSP